MPARVSPHVSAPVLAHLPTYANQLELERKLLWTYRDLAAVTELPVGTLRRRVREGSGPRVTVVGKHHRFAIGDVHDWIEQLRDNCGGRV